MNLPQTDKKRLVIIGGGFAGISLAKKLKDLNVQLVMIDKHNYHTFQPLLYQVSTSGLEPDSIAYPIRKVLKRLSNFHFRLAEVERIDADMQKVYTSIGDLTYDYLVIATGTKTNFFGNQDLIKDIKINLQKNYLGRATFVYKDSKEKDGSVVVCKNQTCSEKLKNLNEVKNYLENKI